MTHNQTGKEGIRAKRSTQVPNWPVTSIEKQETGVVVSSGDRMVSAQYVILATLPIGASPDDLRSTTPREAIAATGAHKRGESRRSRFTTKTRFGRKRAFRRRVRLWDLAFCVFDSGKPTDSLGTIVGSIGGTNLDTWHSFAPEERKSRFMDMLGTSLGEKATVCCHETDWTERPLTSGTPVAFMPIGLLSSARSAMRGLTGRIHFAGTEALPMWSGYIGGALRAGEIAATDVVARLG